MTMTNFEFVDPTDYPLPAALDCLLCGEPTRGALDARIMPYVAAGDDGAPSTTFRWCHSICGLRDVIGGIGHLRDHEYWCNKMGDPDGGMTRHESALAVSAWIAEHGIAATIERGTVRQTGDYNE